MVGSDVCMCCTGSEMGRDLSNGACASCDTVAPYFEKLPSGDCG